MSSTKLLIALAVLLVVLFAVGIGMGLGGGEDRGSAREDSESFEGSEWETRLNSLFSPSPSTERFTKTEFPVPATGTKVTVDPSGEPLRVVTFEKTAPCHISILYVSKEDDKGDLNPQKVRPRNWKSGAPETVSVTLLPGGGELTFTCGTHTQAKCTTKIDLKK